MYMLYFFMNVLGFFHQVLSFVVNHRSYGYFLSDVGEPPEQTEIQDTRRGMFTYLYDHVFKRRLFSLKCYV